MVNRPLSPEAIRGTMETTFQGRPAFESVDPHTPGPMYLPYYFRQCSAGTAYEFYAHWLIDHPKPEEIFRIFDSFQPLTQDNNQ